MQIEPNVEQAKEIDDRFALEDLRIALDPEGSGWITKIRYVIGLPMTALAQRLNISQPALAKLEKNERTGAISLGKLRDVANAMDCDLVYGFVPRRPLVEMTEEMLAPRHEARRNHRK